MRKADHYSYKPAKLILLVYVTHYAFQPIDDVFKLVQMQLTRLRPFFEGVYFMIPIFETSSEVHCLYPSEPIGFTGVEIKKIRSRWFANGDFRREAQVAKD
jgi:hypothetical protein